MVTGMLRMARNALGAEIRSGVIYKGDDVEIIEGAGISPSIKITTKGTDVFETRKPQDVIGAYCLIKLPDEDTPRLFTRNKAEIEQARSASFAGKGPWLTWPQKMAEKYCVKSAIWSLRYRTGTDIHSSQIFELIKQDNESESPVIEGDAVEVEDVYEENPEEGQVEPDRAPTERKMPHGPIHKVQGAESAVGGQMASAEIEQEPSSRRQENASAEPQVVPEQINPSTPDPQPEQESFLPDDDEDPTEL